MQGLKFLSLIFQALITTIAKSQDFGLRVAIKIQLMSLYSQPILKHNNI